MKAKGIGMGERLRRHFRANVVGYLALFVALGGTSAWAVDKVTSKEIKKNAVKSKHLKDGNVRAQDIDPAAIAGIGDGIRNGILGQVVQGRGRTLSAHTTFQAQQERTVLELPDGFGELRAECRTQPAVLGSIYWMNGSESATDFWSEGHGGTGAPMGTLPPNNVRGVALHAPTGATTNAFGHLFLARSPADARRTAMVHAMPLMDAGTNTCTFDVQVLLMP